MTFIEIGGTVTEAQGPFAPERLASEVYSRRFYSAVKQKVITVYAAAVISDNGNTYYPEAITEVAFGESDPDNVTGDNSDCEFDSDISYVDFDTAAGAEMSAQSWLKSLSSHDFF